MTCEHGNDIFNCALCADARNRRRRARNLIVALAAFAEPLAAVGDADPLAGPFGAELADMIQHSPPEVVARLREQLKDDVGALRVIDAALARGKVTP